jgi:hypothetical protein
MRVYGVLIKLTGPISTKADFDTQLETLVSPVAATRGLQRTAAGHKRRLSPIDCAVLTVDIAVAVFDESSPKLVKYGRTLPYTHEQFLADAKRYRGLKRRGSFGEGGISSEARDHP